MQNYLNVVQKPKKTHLKNQFSPNFDGLIRFSMQAQRIAALWLRRCVLQSFFPSGSVDALLRRNYSPMELPARISLNSLIFH